MNEAFLGRLETITLAVAFDRHSVPLVEQVGALCARLGKSLCLLHVVEPWTELPRSEPLGANDPLWNVTQAVESNAQDLAEGRLAELATMVPPEVTVIKRVVRGKPAERIGPEAVSAGSCLIIVGADYSSLKYLPRGLSTALSLLVSSPIPVLVTDTTLTQSLIGAVTRLLVADDLGGESVSALEFAFGLGAGLRKAEVMHIHINPLTLETLRSGLMTAAASAHVLLPPSGTAEEVYDALLDGLNAKLSERSLASGRDYLEAAGGAYVPQVRNGNVSEKLAVLAQEADPHLMIFGRHHAYYTKPFSIGRLPYRSMLAHKRPIIVVPNG